MVRKVPRRDWANIHISFEWFVYAFRGVVSNTTVWKYLTIDAVLTGCSVLGKYCMQRANGLWLLQNFSGEVPQVKVWPIVWWFGQLTAKTLFVFFCSSFSCFPVSCFPAEREIISLDCKIEYLQHLRYYLDSDSLTQQRRHSDDRHTRHIRRRWLPLTPTAVRCLCLWSFMSCTVVVELSCSVQERTVLEYQFVQ